VNAVGKKLRWRRDKKMRFEATLEGADYTMHCKCITFLRKWYITQHQWDGAQRVKSRVFSRSTINNTEQLARQSILSMTWPPDRQCVNLSSSSFSLSWDSLLLVAKPSTYNWASCLAPKRNPVTLPLLCWMPDWTAYKHHTPNIYCRYNT